jgi:hypothetical protein
VAAVPRDISAAVEASIKRHGKAAAVAIDAAIADATGVHVAARERGLVLDSELGELYGDAAAVAAVVLPGQECGSSSDRSSEPDFKRVLPKRPSLSDTIAAWGLDDGQAQAFAAIVVPFLVEVCSPEDVMAALDPMGMLAGKLASVPRLVTVTGEPGVGKSRVRTNPALAPSARQGYRSVVE